MWQHPVGSRIITLYLKSIELNSALQWIRVAACYTNFKQMPKYFQESYEEGEDLLNWQRSFLSAET